MSLLPREMAELADLRRRVADLERQLRQVPSRAGQVPSPTGDGQVLLRLEGRVQWGSEVELGSLADGGGSLIVYQSATKRVEVQAGGPIVSVRSGVTYTITDVATITSSTAAPSGAGVKGQMHMIY